MTAEELKIMRNPICGGTYCTFMYKGVRYLAEKYCVNPYESDLEETMIYILNVKTGSIDINAGEKYHDKTGKSLEDCVIEFCNTYEGCAKSV